jgi:hypothetical protein
MPANASLHRLRAAGQRFPHYALCSEHAVQLRPAVRIDLRLKFSADLEIGSRSQFKGDQMLGTESQPTADVVPRDHEVAAVQMPEVSTRFVSLLWARLSRMLGLNECD